MQPQAAPSAPEQGAPPALAASAPDAGSERKAAESVAAALASLFAPTATNGGKPAGTSAVDLIRQSQQGFAKLEADAKAKAELAKQQGTTKPAAESTDDAKVAATSDKDAQTKANVDRVTALYLASAEPAAKRAA